MVTKHLLKKLTNFNKRVFLVHPAFHYVGTDRFSLGLACVAAELQLLEEESSGKRPIETISIVPCRSLRRNWSI